MIAPISSKPVIIMAASTLVVGLHKVLDKLKTTRSNLDIDTLKHVLDLTRI